MVPDTEGVMTLALAAALVAATVIPYLLRYRRRERAAAEKLGITAGTSLNVPLSMHPQIDLLKCIGCGSCVKACPEGDVLGLVDGLATLINAARCVGHGLCADQCPVGAIRLAALSPGMSADLPVLTTSLETTVGAIFVAGELGGIGLIRNAVQQGIGVVDHIAARSNGPRAHPDVAIIGAGPAGFAAGLAAKKHGLDYLLIEQGDVGGTILQYPRRKVVLTAPVDLPLWGRLKIRSTTKEALLETWQEIIASTGLTIHTDERLLDVKRADGHFVLATTKRECTACNVVLALGRRGTPRKLGVPGEQLPKVAYRLIEAEAYCDTSVLVVGGGDSAAEAAIALAAQPESHVTLSYRKPEFTRLKQRNADRLEESVKGGKVTLRMRTDVKEIREKTVVLASDSGIVEIPNDYIFVFAGGEPPYDLLRKIGVRFHAQPTG